MSDRAGVTSSPRTQLLPTALRASTFAGSAVGFDRHYPVVITAAAGLRKVFALAANALIWLTLRALPVA